MTKQIMCGAVPIGGGARIPIQSMTNTKTVDVPSTVAQIEALSKEGCDIVRCAIPNEDAALSLSKIKKELSSREIFIPIVADIHYDYKLAIAAINNGADKIRINPGNIGGREKLREVANQAKDAGIPIRIGVNSGSVEKELLEKYGHGAVALAESAIKHIEILNSFDFEDIIVSVKSSDVRINTEVCRKINELTDCPQHVGITEAGIGESAIIKSAIGIGSLLVDGIADTIRVSLTGDPLQEIRAAKKILASVNMLEESINIISCPTCGRCQVNLEKLASEVALAIKPIELERAKIVKSGGNVMPLTIAVMGCPVNGPGEASHADIGVACGNGKGAIFQKGEILKTVDEAAIVSELLALLPERTIKA